MGSQFSINERIRKISDFFFSGNTSAMARETSIKQATLRDIISEKVKPSYDTINAIIENSTLNINSEWLITGKGSMLKSEQIPTIKERLNHFIKEQNLNVSDFCKSIGMSFPYFSEMKGSIPESKLKNLMTQYPQLNIAWLMTGEGSMLKSKGESTIDEPEEQTVLPATETNAVNYKLVPLLNLDAVGGMHSLNSEPGDTEYTDKLIPFTDAQNGDVALIISGESMAPTCPSGSKVLIREVKQWKEYFGFGNIFVLLLKDGRRILKEVQKYPEDSKNYVLCKSHNDKYPEEELPKSMITGVWKVIKILNERGW